MDEKGICRLGVIPVRSEPSDRSEMTSQLLFGEHYSVLEISSNGKWKRIRNHFDQYEGWIDATQFYGISPEYFEQINNSEYKICTDLVSTILFRKSTLQIVIGSILPLSQNELFKLDEQLAFNGESKSLGQKREFEFLRQIACKYLNAPYLWGGRSPFGIDCSGFTQVVFRICGYALMRDSSQQEQQGMRVDGTEAMKPGDLAFFSNEKGTVTHTGIVLEDQKIIHASGKVKIDKLDDTGIYVEELRDYSHKLHSIKRIL